MNKITHGIDKLKQENLRLKNENRVLKKALEKRENEIENIREKTERELEEAWKNLTEQELIEMYKELNSIWE